MIGPGTGIAPFRGFLHERRALGASGRNWLFFGERSAATDFLYRDELEVHAETAILTRLDLAFSRDQEHKIYVQDKMFEQAPQFWSWLQDGACIYVCGDATRMAKDVDAVLHAIVEKQGGLNREAASRLCHAPERRAPLPSRRLLNSPDSVVTERKVRTWHLPLHERAMMEAATHSFA